MASFRMRKRSWLVAGLAVAATSALLATGLALAGNAQAAGTVTATFSKDSDWGTGYQAKYTITNGSSASISAWTITFDLPSGLTLGTYWDALMSSSGQHVTAKNREYNGTVAAGASVTFGFIVNGGSGTPTNCLINNAACATGSGGGGGGDTTAPSAPGSLHSTGVTSSSVSLAWNASTDNVGVTGYNVYQGSTQVSTVTGTSATVSGLAASTSYTFTVKATDAAGNLSAASNAVSATTSASTGGGGGGGGTTLATAPYIDMGSWPTPVLGDVATASTLKNFTLAFITSAGCKASWFNAYDPRSGWQLDQINAIRSRGGDVKISFGGASGIELAQACSTVSALTAEYQAVVSAYSLKYIDFDIEGSAVAEPASISLRSQAMKALQNANPSLKISLTLPVLPSGLTADGLGVVRAAVNAGVSLDVVNIMAMDYYQSGDYGDFAIQAAQSTYNQLASIFPGKTSAQLWRLIGVTPMLGQNDDGHVYDKSDASQLVAFAKTNHLGELAFWEVTRDRNACTGALYMCTNIAQSPYDFSKIFSAYTG
jgi:Cellulose binding domain/Fibronectin type III domain/Glycosyl hydrolases family 18